MPIRKTIAFIGDAGKFCPVLTEELAQQDLRLLFVSAEEEKNTRIKEALGHLNPSADIEFNNCETEGCWEADIIAFTDPGIIEQKFIERIKQVQPRKLYCSFQK